jgi:branched-subunit amino acid aminotransferase/4-amino-4-deoxychorismate lyase
VGIRTFETRGRRIWFGAGGGIVADSEPALELDEALAKASGPIAAIGGQMVTPSRSPGRATRRVSPASGHGPRPDPAGGVFETVLVAHGEAICLREHLARLEASLRTLYGSSVDSSAAARARAAVTGAGPGRSRLRILADPDGAVTVTLSPAGQPPDTPACLIPFALPGGLGAHKWRDRRLLDALAAHRPGTVPLLVDTDGAILEAAHANVWIVEGDALVTPPADGRILPGLTRAALLAGTRGAREEPVTLNRLERANAIFLTSSIAGRHAARLATDV